MSAKIDKLIEVLEHSESICRQMLPIFEREKSAAMGSQPEKLSLAVAEKEALVVQMGALERKRQLLIHQISADWRIPADQLKLSNLADCAEGTQAAQIRQITRSLQGLTEKIKIANEENRLLIQHCLKIVRGALGFFQHWAVSADIYGATGQMGHLGKNGHLVSGAI